MISFSDLEKLDTQKMFRAYDRWPEIAKESFESDIGVIDFEECNHIVFSGMGGSGSISDVFASIVSKTDIHVDVVKGYHLPKTVNSKSIIVATSVSGNTRETLSVLEEGKKTGARICSFSSGGEIEKFCRQNMIEFYKVPMYHSPRGSFVSFMYSMLKSLGNIIPIGKSEVGESIEELKKIQSMVNSQNITNDNPAVNLGEWIKETPLIYYPWGLESAATRFKNSLQENAKIHVMTENVIEACHNNIVAWDRQKNFQPILLEGRDDHIKTKERWKILKQFFEEKKIPYKEINSQEGGILTKLCCLIYMLDYASIYLAVKLGVDPTPVLAIDYIKNKLN